MRKISYQFDLVQYACIQAANGTTFVGNVTNYKETEGPKGKEVSMVVEFFQDCPEGLYDQICKNPAVLSVLARVENVRNFLIIPGIEV